MNSIVAENYRFIRALKRKPVDKTPVWIMRQAGRYLPEYRALRKTAGSLLNFFKTPELACQATLLPIQRYPLDAAILFSDILTIPDALGLGLEFIDGEGPRFLRPIMNARDVAALPPLDIARNLAYVPTAIRLIQQELAESVPLIGFSGSPWTLATYMVGEAEDKVQSPMKVLAYSDPSLAHQLLNHLTIAVTDYLIAQIEAGVNAVMLFDTWGGTLTPAAYSTFSLNYMAKIVNVLTQQAPHIPVILFSKGAHASLEAQAATGCAALGLDWTIDIGVARQRVGHHVALQGNLDPTILLTCPSAIKTAVADITQAFGPHPGLIFNLGHGITPNVPPEHVDVLIEALHI